MTFSISAQISTTGVLAAINNQNVVLNNLTLNSSLQVNSITPQTGTLITINGSLIFDNFNMGGGGGAGTSYYNDIYIDTINSNDANFVTVDNSLCVNGAIITNNISPKTGSTVFIDGDLVFNNINNLVATISTSFDSIAVDFINVNSSSFITVSDSLCVNGRIITDNIYAKSDGTLVIIEQIVPSYNENVPATTTTAVVDGDHCVICESGIVRFFNKIGSRFVQNTIIPFEGINFTTPDLIFHNLAIDGTTVAIGEFNAANENNNLNSGKIHIYEYINEEWINTNILFGSTSVTSSIVGKYLDMENNMIVCTDATLGVAYVFQKTGASWFEQDIISSTTPLTRDIKIIGDDIIIGSSSGSIYIFNKTGSSWSTSIPQIISPGNLFWGFSIDAYNNTFVICEFSSFEGFKIYEKTGSTWNPTQEFTTSDIVFPELSSLGQDVSIFENIIYVSDFGSALVGVVLKFMKTGSTWYFTNEGFLGYNNGDNFGSSIDFDGETLIVGINPFNIVSKNTYIYLNRIEYTTKINYSSIETENITTYSMNVSGNLVVEEITPATGQLVVNGSLVFDNFNLQTVYDNTPAVKFNSASFEHKIISVSPLNTLGVYFNGAPSGESSLFICGEYNNNNIFEKEKQYLNVTKQFTLINNPIDFRSTTLNIFGDSFDLEPSNFIEFVFSTTGTITLNNPNITNPILFLSSSTVFGGADAWNCWLFNSTGTILHIDSGASNQIYGPTTVPPNKLLSMRCLITNLAPLTLRIITSISYNGDLELSPPATSTFTNVFTVSQNNPSADFSTIKDAIAHINTLSPSSTNRFVIQLDSETYNTSSGETFPITVPSYTWLVGAGGSQAMDLGSNFSATMITHSETNTGNSWMIRLSNPGSGLFNLALYYNRASSTGDVYGVIIRTGSNGSEINNCLIYTLNTVSDRCVAIYIDGTSDYLNILNSKLYARSNVASSNASVIWNNRTAGAVESIMVKNCIMQAFHSGGNDSHGYLGGAHSRAGTTNLGFGVVLQDCYITAYSSSDSYCIRHVSTSTSSYMRIQNCHLEARGSSPWSYFEGTVIAGYGSLVELYNVTLDGLIFFNIDRTIFSFPIIKGNCGFVSCKIVRNATQNYLANVKTKVAFNAVQYDTNSVTQQMSDASLNRIYMCTPGIYTIIGSYALTRSISIAGVILFSIEFNTISDIVQDRRYTQLVEAGTSITTTQNITAIDFVECYIRDTTSSGLIESIVRPTFLSVFKIA